MNNIKDFLFDENTATDQVPGPLLWLFRHNDNALLQWSSKLQFFEESQRSHIEHLEHSLRKVDLNSTTKSRLEKQIKAEKLHLEEFRELLKLFPLIPQNALTQNLVPHRIPTQQHIGSYVKNIFRDWVWGSEENKAYAEYLKSLNLSPQRILVVGGGAGRTTYDLMGLFPQAQVVQMDINPLLSVVAQKVINGEELKLTEVTGHTLESETISKTHKIRAPGPVLSPERCHIVLGDISDHLFKDACFDLVICPWVVDVVPEPFSSLSRRLNGLLAKNGHLVIFGPLSFERQTPDERLTSAEVEEVLSKGGFGNTQISTAEVPYLQSPLDPFRRFEKIVFVSSQKMGPGKKPGAFHFYPEWMRDTRKAPPSQSKELLKLLNHKNLELQVLNGIYQGQSISQLASLAASQTGVPPEQTESLILGILGRLYESGELK